MQSPQQVLEMQRQFWLGAGPARKRRPGVSPKNLSNVKTCPTK